MCLHFKLTAIKRNRIRTIVIVEYMDSFPSRIGGGNASRQAAESPAPRPATYAQPTIR